MDILFDEQEDLKEIPKYENLLNEVQDAFSEIEAEGVPGIIFIAHSKPIGNLYLAVKAQSLRTFSRAKVRTQFLKKETAENYLEGKGFEFLLMNIATAIYAKIGGIPWKLASSLLPLPGLFIGISFVRRREQASDKETIYYGAVEVLDKYGQHLVTEIRLHAIPTSDFKTKGLFIPYEEMCKLLTSILERYNKPPLIVVHKSAKFVEDEELRAIREITQQYSEEDYRISYAALHIKRDVIYRLFDHQADDLSPLRGTLIVDKASLQTKNWRLILFTTGRQESSRKRTKLGTPKPLEIAVEEIIAPLNHFDLAYQTLALTKLDWNTTELEIRTPITLKYSHRAARLASCMLAEEAPNYTIGDIRDLM